MKNASISGKILFGLGMGLLLLPACGKSGLGISRDAARDTTNAPGEPPVADTPPLGKDDLPTTMPDLPNTPDLPPSDPALALDLRPSGDLLDTNQPDRAGPPDSTITLDEGPGGSYYCTSTGGTVATRQCCSGTSDFFDTCTTAVGGCGCSPANSVATQMCSCPSPSCFLPGYGCVGPGSTCTVGMDQTCNDSPFISSIHGHCVAGGRCVCGTAGMSPTSGKCL
jgi:hypothetical protein